MHTHTHTHYIYAALFWHKWQQMALSLEALRIDAIFYPHFYVATYLSGNKLKTDYSSK
jgi:hypothetical protein